jgi:hypothetical protein
MYRLQIRGLIVGLLVAVLLTGCATPIVLTLPPAESQPQANPAEVVESFYAWYLEQVETMAGTDSNPLTGGVYREAAQLDSAFVEEVDQIVAGFDRGGYDPFLLAQDIPTAFRVGEVEVADSSAHVLVYTTFFGHVLDVSLAQEEGGWLITGVEQAATQPDGEDPQALVEWFYAAYLNYPGNPLVSRAFLSQATMTAEFVEKVNGILNSFDKGGYDPILMAQDVPTSVEVGEAQIEGSQATVPIATSFEGHSLIVTLQQEDGVWKIADIEQAPSAE